MIRGQQLTAIIPVRGGSRGIPSKNLMKLGRDSLLVRTIKMAKACGYIDRIVVSTDHAEMYAIAKQYGVTARTLRPPELATDTAKTVDVVNHVIGDELIAEGYIILLQVTSPLRTLADANVFCKGFDEDTTSEASVSLVEFDSPHPDKIQKVENGRVVSYLGKESMVARQQLPKVYALNGAFYLTHRDVLLTQKTFMPKATLPFVMPRERSLNLDGKHDVLLLEALVAKGVVEIEEYV
jgi:CMP-N-acetylneuraminic acid synthetase